MIVVLRGGSTTAEERAGEREKARMGRRGLDKRHALKQQDLVASICVQYVEECEKMAPYVRMDLSSMARRRARSSACTLLPLACSPHKAHVAHVLQLGRV
jgi:hypothetical protein